MQLKGHCITFPHSHAPHAAAAAAAADDGPDAPAEGGLAHVPWSNVERAAEVMRLLAVARYHAGAASVFYTYQIDDVRNPLAICLATQRSGEPLSQGAAFWDALRAPLL